MIVNKPDRQPKHRGYRSAANQNLEALEQLRDKLGGKLTPGTGKRKREPQR